MSANAATDTDYAITPFSVDVDGWTILAVSDGDQVSHLIAARTGHLEKNTDVDVVLYTRLQAGWAASAYDPSVTIEDALADIAQEFGLASPLSVPWPVDLDPTQFTEVVPSRNPFDSGFFISDPLSGIASQMANPEPLVSAAEDAGVAAGGSVVNTGSLSAGDVVGPEPVPGCPPRNNYDLQDAIATGFDSLLAGVSVTIGEAESIAFVHWENQRACCIPWTWTTTTTAWGPWYCCSGWALDPAYPSPIQNGPCSANCHYERDICRDRTRTRVRRLLNCTRCTWTEVQTEKGQHKGRATVDLSGSGCVIPAGFACPGVPDNIPACTDPPHTGVSKTGWVGTPPC